MLHPELVAPISGLPAAQAGGPEAGLEDVVGGIVSGCFYLGCGLGPVAGGILTDLIGAALPRLTPAFYKFRYPKSTHLGMSPVSCCHIC